MWRAKRPGEEARCTGQVEASRTMLALALLLLEVYQGEATVSYCLLCTSNTVAP